MMSEREIRAKEEGEKWERKAYDVLNEFIKILGINKMVSIEKSYIKECDYFIVWKSTGDKTPVEVKKIKEKVNHTFYNIDTGKKYHYKRYGFLKIIKKNHDYLLKNKGFYLIFIHNGNVKKMIVMAKTLDKFINHDDDDIYKRYYSVSTKNIIDMYNELFKTMSGWDNDIIF